MEDGTEPRWLDVEEQQNWYALAYALIRLPAALDAQMQRDAGISHFEYLVLSGLSIMPDRTQRMSDLAVYTASTLSRLSNVVVRLEKRGWVSRAPAISGWASMSSRRGRVWSGTPGVHDDRRRAGVCDVWAPCRQSMGHFGLPDWPAPGIPRAGIAGTRDRIRATALTSA